MATIPHPHNPNEGRRAYLLLLIVVVILLGLSMTSCMTDSKLSRMAHERGICPTVKDSTRIKDSTAIHYRDSIIYHAAKDAPTASKEIDCKDSAHKCCWRDAIEDLKRNPVKKSGNGLTTTLKSDGKKIDCDCHEDAWKQKLDDVIRERDIYKSEYHKVVVKEKCLERHHSTWDTICNWGFIICLLLILGRGFFLVRRGLLRIPWP